MHRDDFLAVFMKLLSLQLVSLLLSGCALYYAQYPDRHPVNQKLDPWLGKTKEERIKAMGTPDACTPLKEGGEVCEWRFAGIAGGEGSTGYVTGYRQSPVESWQARVIFIYDSQSIAKEWNYWDSQGTRRSSRLRSERSDSGPR